MDCDEENDQISQKNHEQIPANTQTMSKRQQKRLANKQKWEKDKKQKNKIKREKQKEKKKLKKQLLTKQEQNFDKIDVKQQKQSKSPLKQQQGQMKEMSHEKIQAPKQIEQPLMRKRRDEYIDKMKEGIRVVIDLQFWDLMVQKQRNSLIKQLSYCHSINRKSVKPFNYILSSATTQRQDILSHHYNGNRWGITMLQEGFLEVYPHEKIIYLTGDATEQLAELDDEHVYIIGGIVDHNRLKSITMDFARENGLAARRLPMDGVKLKASVHIAVNHVWEWMLRRNNGQEWKEAIKAVIPVRKRVEEQNVEEKE